jgi:hypothetical protein
MKNCELVENRDGFTATFYHVTCLNELYQKREIARQQRRLRQEAKERERIAEWNVWCRR